MRGLTDSPLATRTPPLERPRPLHEGEAVSGNGNGNGRPRKLPTINGHVVDPKEISAEVERDGRRRSDRLGDGDLSPKSSLRGLVPEDQLGDGRHRSSASTPSARFFYLDTELLFPETYATRDALAEHYGIEFDRFAGITLAEQEERHGANLWRRDPDACCGIRKVEAMREALDGAECWVSGIRRVDSETRAAAAKFGWDKRFGLWKLNPLADWDDKRVWNHIKEHHVPYNPLHDQGYPSIGCMPCTSKPGEGESRSRRPLGRNRPDRVRHKWVAPRRRWR